MSWVRIHDGVMTNAKVGSLSDAGFRLWIIGLCYCQTALTDGLIPKEALRQMGAKSPTIRELTTSKLPGRAPLWEPDPVGYKVHDYLQWNLPREEVLKKREVLKTRVRRHRNGVQPHVGNALPKRYTQRLDPSGSGSGTQKEEESSKNGNGTDSDPRTVLEPAESLRWFDRVYAAYPNKDRKLAANEAWAELGPDLATAQAILADVQRRVKAGWVRFERRFIPQLVKFINERQWEDDQESVAIHEETDDGERYAWSCKCGQVHEGTAEQNRQRVCLKDAKVNA